MRLVTLPLVSIRVHGERPVIHINPECVSSVEAKSRTLDNGPFCAVVLNDGRVYYADNDAETVRQAFICVDVYRVERGKAGI